MLERIQKFRRDLHQIPELELELPKTQRYVQETLRDFHRFQAVLWLFLTQEERKASPFAVIWMHYR